MLLNSKWPTTGLALDIDRVDRNALVKEYEKTVNAAPRRHDRGKPYFVTGHDGCLPGNAASGRFEEHLAMAIWRFRGMHWPRLDGGWFQFLDYQFPLKDAQANPGVGKIDLLGVTNCGRLLVSELKVARSTGRGESPMAALMQGLRYAAIVDANSDAIACEAAVAREVSVDSDQRPVVQILAPKKWWHGWLQLEGSTRRKAGPWEREFAALTYDIEKRLGIPVECLAMDDIQKADLYRRPTEPTLETPPIFYSVRPGEEEGIGSALLSSPSTDKPAQHESNRR